MNEAKFYGLAELEASLNELPDKMAKTALRTASRRSGQIVQRKAQSLAHVRTGKLRSGIAISIRVRGEGVRGSTVYTTIGLKKNVWYGRLLEFGTKFIAPIPFLGPAFEQSKQQMLDTFKQELGSAISKIKAKIVTKS